MINKIQDLQKFISKLSRKEKAFLYATGFIVLIMLSDRLLISPIFFKLKSLNEQIKEKEASIMNDIKILSQKDRIKAASESYGSFSAERPLSEDEEINAFLKEIEGITSKTSVYLVDIKPGNSKRSGNYRKYLINLNCEAQMEQIMNFMHSVEDSTALLSVEKYQISPKSKDSSLLRCSIAISKTFVEKGSDLNIRN